MAGSIKKIENAFCAVHVLCIITGVVCFIASIIQVVFYNRWMVEFISQQHHNTVFAYLQVISYVLVTFGILNLKCKIDLRVKINWWKIIIFLSAAVVILAGSTFFITRVVMFRPEVSRQCQSFVDEIKRIQEAKTVFCYSCKCYLYEVYGNPYPNMTNWNDNAPSKITQCPNWKRNELDGKLGRLQNDLDCSGWCRREPIFYFSANDYWYYDNNTGWHHNRAIVKGSCYSSIKSTVQSLTYRLPLAMAALVILLHIPLLAFLMQAVRQKATSQ